MTRVRLHPEVSRSGPPLKESPGTLERRHRDRAGDLAFIAAVLPWLDEEARARAAMVRLRPGDPVRDLVGE